PRICGICGKRCAETSAAGTVDVVKTKGVALELRTVPKSAPNRSSELEKHRWRNIKSFAQVRCFQSQRLEPYLSDADHSHPSTCGGLRLEKHQEWNDALLRMLRLGSSRLQHTSLQKTKASLCWTSLDKFLKWTSQKQSRSKSIRE